MRPGRIVVAGGGFGGLWAAMGAARALDELGPGPAPIEVVLVNPDPFHVVRVRCYEAELGPIRVELDRVLRPIGVRRVEARVTGVNAHRRVVTLRGRAGTEELSYDRLVLATGSALHRPPIPGLAEHAFDVDTHGGAERLARHIGTLADGAEGDGSSGRWTAVVVGAGLVGIEIACELPARLREAQARAAALGRPVPDARPRVLLLDHAPEVGAAMGAATPAVRAALDALGVEARGGTKLAAVDGSGIVLGTGERIAAMTVVCATGMRASCPPGLPADALDGMGRLPVDAFLRVEGVEDVHAAGDLARARADEEGHATVMSCQHARPMGRIAGYNAACDLLGRGEERRRFAAPEYVTVLDLGPWGAAYTAGWDRAGLVAAGATAKAVKREINARRIYPPLDDRLAILDAAAPATQPAPRPTLP